MSIINCLRLQADGDSRQLALTSEKYTLKSMILKDSPSAPAWPWRDMHITLGSPMLHIVVHKQLLRAGIELATFGLLEKRLDLTPREVRCF